MRGEGIGSMTRGVPNTGVGAISGIGLILGASSGSTLISAGPVCAAMSGMRAATATIEEVYMVRS